MIDDPYDLNYIENVLSQMRQPQVKLQTPLPASSPLAATAPRFLDRYRIGAGFPEVSQRLPMEAFQQAPLPQRGAVSELPDDGFGQAAMKPEDLGTAISKLGGKQDTKGVAQKANDYLDAVMRMLALPVNYGQNTASTAGQTRGRAMTPLEGPDTGAENPNASAAPTPGGYFARLRGPEGTAGNANAVNPVTGASGPYQFLPSTWRDLMSANPSLGLTWEGFSKPSENMAMHDRAIGAYTDKSIKMLTKELGRAPTAGELYAMHFFGHNGGMNFIRNLDAPLSATAGTPAVLSSNPWLYSYANRPGRDLLARLTTMMGR